MSLTNTDIISLEHDVDSMVKVIDTIKNTEIEGTIIDKDESSVTLRVLDTDNPVEKTIKIELTEGILIFSYDRANLTEDENIFKMYIT